MYELISKAIDNYVNWLSYLALTSIIFLILSILLIPKLIAQIPCDYFSSACPMAKHTPLSINRVVFLVVKNIAGAILIISGVLMLVLPGQGLLTIIVGLVLLNFPGKYKFERWLIKKPAILKSINWIRGKQNIPALQVDKCKTLRQSRNINRS